MDRNTRGPVAPQGNENNDDRQQFVPRRQAGADDGASRQNPARRTARNETYDDLDIQRHLDELGAFLQHGKTPGRLLGGARDDNIRLIDIDHALQMLEDIRESIPAAIRQAQRVLEERDRLIQQSNIRISNRENEAMARSQVALTDANNKADAMLRGATEKAARIVSDAESKQRTLINETEVRRIAQVEAQRMMADARARRDDMYSQTLQYVDEQLGIAQQTLEQLLSNVSTSREEFKKANQH